MAELIRKLRNLLRCILSTRHVEITSLAEPRRLPAKAQLHSFAIDWQGMPQSRGAHVFFPAGDARLNDCPVLFCADGQCVQTLAPALDRAIADRRIVPVVLVGIESDDQFRAEEYLWGVDPSRFEVHERLFCETVPKRLASVLRLTLDHERTGAFGFSNGGALALTMGQRHPDLFGTVIAFSVPPNKSEPWQKNAVGGLPRPRTYLAAGKREKPILKNTRAIAHRLQRSGVPCILQERDVGHEWRFWEQELPIALEWSYGRLPECDGKS